jgi:hypothetical protein
MNSQKTSWREYEEILGRILKSEKLCDYPEATERDEFIILRHDVDLSLQRAFYMSKIENRFGITASYFFLIDSDAYNIHSVASQKLLREMTANGHHLGLHFRHNDTLDFAHNIQKLQRELKLLGHIVDTKIDRFAFHMPSKHALRQNFELPGISNAYAPSFFTLFDNPATSGMPSVKYLSDSCFEWAYGYPDDNTLSAHPRVQLLIHPESWSAQTVSKEENAHLLLNDKIEEYRRELIETYLLNANLGGYSDRHHVSDNL